MKRLSSARNSDSQYRSRGQIILLAAVAMILIVLTMITLLNTAAFTDTERADGVTNYQDETHSLLFDTEYAVETALRHVNHDTNIEDEDNSERENRIEEEISGIEQQLGAQAGSEAAQLTIELEDTNTNGVRLFQPSYDDLAFDRVEEDNGNGNGPPDFVDLPDNAAAGPDYDITDNANAVRSFTIDVTGENLNSTDNDPFTVQFGSYSDVEIAEDPDNPVAGVLITNGDTDCRTVASESDTTTIAFTHGLVDGEPCDALPGTEDISSIGFRNADAIEAALDMVMDVDADDVFDDGEEDTEKEVEDGPDENPDEPQAHHALYSVTVDVTIQTPGSEVTTPIRVTPNLPGDTPSIYDGGGG